METTHCRAQERRLAESAAFVAAWNASFSFDVAATPARVSTDVVVSEGAVSAAEAALLVDPLGLARLSHDDASGSMDAAVLAAARAVRAAVAPRGLDDARRDCRERLTVPPTFGGATNTAMRVSIVNMVHTNYIGARGRELDSDEESESGRPQPHMGRATRNAVRLLMEDTRALTNPGLFELQPPVANSIAAETVYAGAPGTPGGSDDDMSVGPPTAAHHGAGSSGSRPIMSLRWMQRRMLRVGFNKNEVGTALGIRFARPWTSSHHIFPTGRVQTTGANNRFVDRVLLKRGTVRYLRAAGAGALRVTRRKSQNIVAKHRLPTPDGLSIGLFAQQHLDNGALTESFKGGICVKLANLATMLLFRKGSVICVGTSSVARLQQAFAHMEPEFRGSYYTPATVALEQRLVAVGLMRRELVYADAERVRDADARATRTAERARRRAIVRAGLRPVFRRRILGVACYC